MVGYALGVWFCTDCEESKKNYEKKVHKVEDIMNDWRNKKLALIGKIAVMKALAASQLNSQLFLFFHQQCCVQNR